MRVRSIIKMYSLAEMEKLPTNELIQIAQATLPTPAVTHLQTLLMAQQQRSLTPAERQEAEQLVAQEDLYTLRKAKALFLLKQRHALPHTH